MSVSPYRLVCVFWILCSGWVTVSCEESKLSTGPQDAQIKGDSSGVPSDFISGPTPDRGLLKDFIFEPVPDGSAHGDIIAGPAYFVSTAGDDTNPGTQAKPWRTIQKAADTVMPGDTVIVLAGIYSNDLIHDLRIHLNKSGASGKPIAFRASGVVKTNGFTVSADYNTIAGFDIVSLADGSDAVGIFVEKCGGCIIEDNYIHASTMGGIILSGTPADPSRSHDCVVRRNRLYRNGMYGIEVKGQNHLIEQNEIWGTIQHHPCMIKYANETWLDADGMRFHGSGHVFRKNKIHDITYGPTGWTQGIACGLANVENAQNDFNADPHIDCFQTYSASDKEVGKDILFEQNFCKVLEHVAALDIGGKGFQVDNGSTNLIMRNNVMEVFGIALIKASSTVTIVNNTFVGTAVDYGAVGIYLTNAPNVTIKNNIFAYQENGVGSIYPDAASKATLVAGYNNVYRLNGQKPSGTANPHDLWGVDPQFVNPSQDDFSLKSTSPCIDAGETLAAVKDDYSGTPRPKGNGYDIGAYEQ
jgi:hypothetical protein